MLRPGTMMALDGDLLLHSPQQGQDGVDGTSDPP